MADATPNTGTDIEACWQQLETVCSNAIEISEKVAEHLDNGAPVHQVVLLLRKQARLSQQLRTGIVDGRPYLANAGSRGLKFATQMKALLDLEEKNYRLLSRKGMRLSGPRRSPAHNRSGGGDRQLRS